jgi:carboxymethylenebutenolidase
MSESLKYHLALPKSGSGPGVLVLHAWWGLNDFIKEFCDRLAEEGFVVLAPDLFSGRIAKTIAEAETLNPEMDEQKEMPPLVLAAIEELSKRASGAIATIGFSFGAYWARWLAQEKADWLRAVNVFYGNGWNIQQSNAAYQYHFAETDPYVSEEDKKGLAEGLSALGRPATFHTYPGTGHWFMETDRPDAYNAEAAKLAWERTIAFLREQLGS